MGGIMSGNPNCRKHGSTDQYPSIDSYAFHECLKRGDFPVHGKAGGRYTLIVEADRAILREGGKGPEIVLYFDFVPNHYGGKRAYFHCPFCGERARKVYLYQGFFRCRKCAGLNYPSQQVTKGHDLAYLKMKRAALKLSPTAAKMNPHELTLFTPERPKGMRHDTYFRLMAAFSRSKETYHREFMKACGAILRKGP